MPDDLIPRRTLLDCAVRLAALPAGIAFLSAWGRAAENHQHSSGVIAPPQPSFFDNYQPKFFSPADFEALRSLTELLIPTDGTPGAREAHCSEFIDFLLHSVDGVSPDIQKQWPAAMTALKEAGFNSATPAAKSRLLEAISKPERESAANHPAYFAYRLIKRENAFAFYTARTGIIDNLEYRGNSYNLAFPACTHPEHHEV